MKAGWLGLFLLSYVCAYGAGGIPDGGFESGGVGQTVWKIEERTPMTSYSRERAHSGEWSLKIVDRDGVRGGSSAVSPRLNVKGGKRYELGLWFFCVSGSGLGVYVWQYDQAGQRLKLGNGFVQGLGEAAVGQWHRRTLDLHLDPAACSIAIWLHSYSKAKVEGYLDDLDLVEKPYRKTPPWTPQYKIRPEETQRLTAADVVGPDGIVYPNWTRCGREGGIPQIEDGVNIRDFGGVADDDKDDSEALRRAIAAAGNKAVRLNEGQYILASPVLVERDGVVIRGSGMGKTKILFTYSLQRTPVRFACPEEGDEVLPGQRLEVHAMPTGLERIEVRASGKLVHSWKRGQHSGNTYRVSFGHDRLARHFSTDQRLTLEATAIYGDGRRLTATRTVQFKATGRYQGTAPAWESVLQFRGRVLRHQRWALARDGKRGDTVLELKDGHGVKVGDYLLLEGPGSKRWKALTENACLWGIYRRHADRVLAVNGNLITLSQPLRIEFPVIDGSLVQRIEPIFDCGVEDLTIEQTDDLWINTVWFRVGWNCWAKNIEVIKCGRFPVYGSLAKFCEFRNLVFRDAWFKGGGGTAYAGWENCWDCLIDGIETYEYRHAPLFQWSASGCVVRNGVFHHSDAQWHSGWTHENLMEQCVVTSVAEHGSYGYGMWASPPEDDAHGPNGPRNVVYNCDVKSPRDGVWLGGMNENWLFLHNRFEVEQGHGIFIKDTSFDHIFRDNVLIVKDASKSGLQVKTPDCFRVDFQDNTVYGTSLLGGHASCVNAQGNRLLPLPQDTSVIQRPRPAVPSIFAWQRTQARKRKR